MCILQCLGYCPKSYVRVLTQSNTLTIAREKAAKALKEKGETPEELLQSIKENEAAVAEAQRVVDAWKAIVGEKARREEAAKAEAERIAAEERERAEAEEEARVEAERKAEEERKTKEEERKERDENGQPFVVSSDGTTTFGEITEDTGLTVAPIKLSEGVADEKGNGYGLRHIEARHGDQIRKAGFSSVEEFVKYVASNYDKHNIKIGKKRANGVETYLIQAEDEHSNMLYVELSKDGSYWNVNSGGIFRKGYAEKKKDVGQNTEHPTSATTLQDKSFVQTDKDNGSQSADTHSDKQHPSADKGTTLAADQQSSDKENTKKVADSEGENTLKAKIEAASADVNTEPTEAQKEAGNYKKGHVQVGTFDITIEQPEGSIRRGTDADGKQWEIKMHNTYGYFRGTEGVDGDHIDVFLSNDIDGWNGRKVFVVDQYNPDGTFDEHKVMLGFNDMDEAKSDYLANYEKGWENGRRITVSTTNLEDFEKWIDSSHRKTKPFSEYSSVNKETVATDKGGEKAEKKQEKQSVFDKAKEIADKEEKKRKAEADKPKQKPLTEAERKDAEEVAGALGYRVEWVDTMEENGTIDADRKVIRIAKDAENPLVQVQVHEVAHGVKRMDGGKFKALQKAAMEVVGEKEWNERIEKKRKLNAYAEGKLAEEVTCDIVGEALNNKDALKRLAESLRGEKGIIARLRDAVAKMVEYFKNRGDKEGVRRMKAADKLLAEFESALKDGDGVNESAREADVPTDNVGNIDFSHRTYHDYKDDDGNEHRGTRGKIIEYLNNAGMKKSDIGKFVDNMDYWYDLTGKVASLVDKDGNFDFPAFHEWSQTSPLYKKYEGNIVRAVSTLVSNGEYPLNFELSTDCIKREAFTQILNEMVDLGGAIWKNLTPAKIQELRTLQQSYGIQVACPLCFVEGKRLNIMKWATGVTDKWNEAVRRVVGDEATPFGFGKGTYVPATPYNERTTPQEVTDQINEVARIVGSREGALPKDLARMQENTKAMEALLQQYYEDYVAKHGSAEGFSLSEAQLGELAKLRGKGASNVVDRMVDMIATHPELQHTLDVSDLVGSKGLMAIRGQSGEGFAKMYSLIVCANGTGTPKIVQDAQPYSGEILDVRQSKFDKAAEIGGARLFSFSDFDLTKTFDIMQIMWDCAARKAKVQSYSKEIPYILMFGKSGVKINMSMLPEARPSEGLVQEYKEAKGSARKYVLEKIRENAGLDMEGGHIVGIQLSDSHSVSKEFAESIYHNPDYNANCGAIMVGISVNHALYAMGQDYIRQVIPFHLSGMPISARRATDCQYNRDFTSEQNTGIIVNGRRVKQFDGGGKPIHNKDVPSDFDFYEGENEKGWDMRQRCRDYVKWCGENGLVPRFEWAVNSDNYKAWCKKKGYQPNQEIVDMMDAHTTDGVYDEYYKVITDFTAYKPIFDKDGNTIGEEPAPHRPVTGDFSMDDKTLGMVLGVDSEGRKVDDNSMLANRENTIKNADANKKEIAEKALLILNGKAKVEDLVRRGGEQFDNNSDSDKFFESSNEGIDRSVRESRSEKTELTAEERELRDNLVERMRKGGLDVVTDSEEMQRVIDTENERTRMTGAGSVREHRVYHGSGADFDAFDHSHMGEGEGAQAYGWGTYVTEVEGIGRTYANATAHNYNKALRPLERKRDSIRNSLRIEALELDSARGGLRVAVKAKAKAEENYEEFLKRREEIEEKYGKHSTQYDDYLWNSPYAIAVRAIEHYENKIKERETKLHSLQKDLEETKKQIENIAKEFPRHLYTVEIPDDNGGNYLDWNDHPAESLLKGVGSFLESEGFERVQDNPVRYEKGESTVVLNPNATGADLYAELREALGSDKKASQALSELGCIGIKYPADNMRGGRKDGAKNYVIFNENDAKITDHTRFLRTAGGEVYGLVKDGRIYLDPKVATAETAVHEYTHLWGDMLRRKDSEQWNHTVKELKNSVLWEEVKELYPELKTDDEIADEVLSTFSGRRGAERLREEARRVADGDGGVFTKAKAIETLERVKEAIARFWEGVARMFGINRYRSAEELADMAMRDLLDSKNPMKDESGMRKRGEVGETLATSGTYFSGGGLLEAGLKGVIDPKVAVEFSEKIAGVYADNHGNHIVVADVRDVDPKKLVGAVDGGEVQYFHASPVCKNFSKAKREGGEVELDKETALSTAEFIAKTRPKVVTIENVKGYRNSEALKIITDELTRQGYDWDADVYNAADYGGYTKRERLIVRAKRDGKLPPKPEKLPEELRKKGWYSAVEDLIPHLEEKKTGVPQGTDERLKNSGIDYRTIDKPLYVFGRGYANKTVGHAFADELLPTLTTGGGDIIIMPDGRVLKASPRVLARVTGLPDTYKMPETDQLSHTIVGNGIPTQLTEGVIAPLLDNAIPSAERATKRESVFDVADRVSQNLEERTRAMGSRVEKRMADVAQKLEGRELTAEQKAVVDVFSGEKDNQKFSVERNGLKQQFLLKQGQEDKAGAKHSLYRHYGTNTGVITADDVLKIPQVLERGERIEKAKGGKKMAVYTMDIDGVKYTVLTRVGKNNEIVDDFYSNKKGSESSVYRNVENIDNTPEGARRKDSEPSAKVEDKSESPKLFGEEIIDDGKKSSDSIDRSVRENPKNEDKPRFSRKPGESIFDYASRVSEDVDRSVRERVSARDEYEKKVKSKGFQTKEALQNSMLGLQEFMSAIDHASGNKRYIEDIPDFENPILGENRLSSVNKEEMHQVAKTQFKPLMSAVVKLSGNGKESGELYDYMFAKHGLERDAVMRQREAQKEFDKYQKANPKGTKTIGDFVASLEGKDYAGLTALTAEDGRVKSIQSQIDAIDEQMKATDDQLLLRKLGGQKKRLKVDLLNAARDAADDIRKAFESNPSHDRSDINELWSRVNEVNGNTLRKLYESGMLTKEAYNDISSMYTNYIPMRGFDQTTSADAYAYLTHGDSAFNAPIKTAKGRSSKADNPIAYMQAMAESAIMQGNRNVLVKQKMLNFVRNHPSDLASVSDVWLQYDSVADEWKPVFPDNIGANDSASVVAKKMEAFEDKMKQMAEKHPDLVQRSNEAPDIPYKVVEKGQLNEHQVLVKQNGKSYIITVNGSPRAAQAANGLTNPDTDLTGAVGKVFEGAEALNRQLSSLYTTLNPDFIGSNYVRDALYSNTMVYVKEGAKYGGFFNFNFAKYNPAEMANLYASYNKGSLDTSNETHRLFLEFMQNGGETGFVNLKQIEKRKSEIAKAIKRDGEISAAQIWGGLNDAIDFANRAVENSARFAAYVTSRKSGRSVGRSVYDAKEISVNFNRKGSGRNWWKDNVGTSRFYDTEIGLVEINRASVGSSLAHRYSQVKLDVITSLAEGFNNAVYFGSMQDFSRQEGVKSHYFAYPINYNGHRNYVFCRAMQDANKNRLYVHEVFLADNIEKGNTLQTAASQPHGGITLYKDILANVLAANVTNDSETSKPRFSRKPGESIFDYASRVSEDVDRSVCEGR